MLPNRLTRTSKKHAGAEQQEEERVQSNLGMDPLRNGSAKHNLVQCGDCADQHPKSIEQVNLGI